MLFGDNKVDKYRVIGAKRMFFGGQAGIIGPYDRLTGYGITTELSIDNGILQKYRDLFKMYYENIYSLATY